MTAAQPGPISAPALELTSKSWGLAREFPKFPYKAHSQPFILHVHALDSDSHSQFLILTLTSRYHALVDLPTLILAHISEGYSLAQPGSPLD